MQETGDLPPGAKHRPRRCCSVQEVMGRKRRRRTLRRSSSRSRCCLRENRKVSELMGSYWSNFAKTGDPNSDGLPRWPAYSQNGYQGLHLRAAPAAAPDEHRARYQFLDGR